MTSATTDRINGVVASTAIKTPVRVATTANITLSGEQTIDGVAVVADDRVLVKNQTTQTENGIYIADESTWSRSKDFDGNRDVVQGTRIPVYAGTVSAGLTYQCTTANDVTIGTDSITFAAVTDVVTADLGRFQWNFDSSTSMADPGSTDLRLNNATLASVTAIAVSATDADSNTIRPYVLTWDDSTTTTLRGTIIIKNNADPTDFAIYSVTGASTDNTTWVELSVTHVASGGSFTAGDDLAVTFTRTGDKGTAGAGSGDLLAANNLSDVANAGTSRTNLGLGTMATQAASSVAITGGTVTGITDLVVADGGTGASTFTDGGVLIGNAAGAIQVTSAGTSGQVLTSNGAGVDPTFQNSSSGAMTFLGSATASASATLDFTSLITATYDTYMFILQDIVPATDNTILYIRTSTNNSTFDAGASDYTWSKSTTGIGSSSTFTTSSTGSTFIAVNDSADWGLSNVATEGGMSGTVMLHNPLGTSGSRAFSFSLVFAGDDSSTAKVRSDGVGMRMAAADVDAVRFLMSSGNITSGKIYMYGIKVA